MLVYGDAPVPRDADELRSAIVSRLRAIGGAPAGLRRHSDLVTTFISAGDLIGGLLDRDHRHGISIAEETGMAGLTRLAQCICLSWDSGFAGIGDVQDAVDAFVHLTCPGEVLCKPAEGYAFYALYPESYALAARNSGLPPETRVIGIRSIGTTLAPMVSAALDARPPLTVRPVGHPFGRQIIPDETLTTALLEGAPPAYAVVDEGPGLSGSSFSAVADWLVEHDVPRHRIHFFPSHRHGPGHEASPLRREQWASAPKHHVSADDTLHGHLESWLEHAVGPLHEPLLDLTGGAWRTISRSSAPAAPHWERPKFLARSEKGDFLVKFAGLGEAGTDKFKIARQLHHSGWGVEPVALLHGFLVEPWLGAATLLEAPPPPDLVEHLARYLDFRAGLAAHPDGGASIEHLIQMAEHNTRLGIGEEAARMVVERLQRQRPWPSPRIKVDARLHRWEWLVDGGRLIKTDALDHAMAHDLIGAQPIAWDIAGAAVEHSLAPEVMLAAYAEIAGSSPSATELDFFLICYLAFQMGWWTIASGSEDLTVQRYRAGLQELLRI